MRSEFIDYEKIDYGSYALTYDHGKYEPYVESVGYEQNDFNRLYFRQVRLPFGKGNIIYLLSSNFDSMLGMVNHKNFVIPTSYRRLFYPWFSVGRFMGRRYKVDVTRLRSERTKLIKEQTKLQAYGSRQLHPSADNVLFSVSDIYEAVEPILRKTTPKRCYTMFYPELATLLKSFTPEPSFDSEKKGDNNRILVIDVDSFHFDPSASVKENKTNPLFLLYLAYLKMRDLIAWEIDLDILICSKNLFIKLNPSKTERKHWITFRRGLFQMMGSNLEDYVQQLSDDEKKELDDHSSDHTIQNTVSQITTPYTKDVSPSTKETLNQAIADKIQVQGGKIYLQDQTTKEIQKRVADHTNTTNEFLKFIKQPETHSIIHRDVAKHPLSPEEEKKFKGLVNYQKLTTDTNLLVDDEDDRQYLMDDDHPDVEDYDDSLEDAVKNDTREILSEDEEIAKEVLDEIQDHKLPMRDLKTSPVSSPRDMKLREEQKKIMVKENTIEEILSMDSSNIPIETDDKSAVMHTTNENMKKIRFANVNKTYLEKSYDKDILACFNCLQDKESPIFITGIDIKDNSSNINLLDTWSVHVKTPDNKRYTMKVDIPKFHENRFLILEGTKYIILNQNLYNPLVKDTPDTVIITTNYNKITVTRKATKSIGVVERIFGLIKKTGDEQKIFTTGDSSHSNMKYISTLEYDELSRRLFKFSTRTCKIYFSRDYIVDQLDPPTPPSSHEFYIGTDHSEPIFIDENTGLDQKGRMIAEIIEENLPEDLKVIYNSIKPPKQSMYADGKVAGQFLPIVVTLIVWIGLKATLDRMGIQWEFHEGPRRFKLDDPKKRIIRFANGYLEYQYEVFAELILNGLNKLHPEKHTFEEFETETCYDDYVYAVWGNYTGINQLNTFYEFLIDPITLEHCKDLKLPTDPPGLLIHAVKLLADNSHVSKASDVSFRTRSLEIIPGILYSCIAKQYQAYRAKGGKIPFTLNQKCVIRELQAQKTVEAYSTLNPVVEVSKTHSISTKGYKGSNSEFVYNSKEKRSYDPSAVGKISLTTSAKHISIGRVKLL